MTLTSLSHLKGLKAFEVAARLGSFTFAAEELRVTQAAISHQIKGLEEKLGFALFHRQVRRLSLTVAGENLFRVLTNAFTEIEDTINDLRKHVEQSASLNIALTPSLSSRWLLPRLGSFTSEFPNIELHLYHSISNRDLMKVGIDVAIKWGDGNWPGLHVQKLMESNLTPVCAPDYVRPEHPLASADDLSHYTLLHEDTHGEWATWLRAAGATQINSNRGIIIDDSNALLLAAINRQGIALGRTPLFSEDLRTGRLIRPFEIAVPCDCAYYITYSPDKANQPAIRSFVAFLVKHSADSETG